MFEYLDLVRQRPGMYVGCDDSHFDKRLDNLVMLIAGYVGAVVEHGLNDGGSEAYERFPSYLRKRFGWSMSCGPISAIREAARNDAEAWALFWKLLDEFKEAERSQNA